MSKHAMSSSLIAVALAFAVSTHAQVLTLEEALSTGEARSAKLAAQRHAVDAAREQAGRAAELPDPRLRMGLENLPVTGADRLRYDRDLMTMRSIGVMQEFPNAEKRAARSGRAARAREVELSMLSWQRSLVRRDIAVAWLDAHFAERSSAVLERLVERRSLESEIVGSGLARGRQGATDVFMLRSAVEEARDRIIEQARIVERARHALAALVGDAAQRPLGEPPQLGSLPHPPAALLARLRQHPQLRVLEERAHLARSEVDLARASRRPDWSLEVGYGQRRPSFDDMVSVMVAIDLPWQAARRQDRDVATRLAELEQARALQEDARRMHEAEVRSLITDYEAASRRLQRYRDTLMPLAADRSEAALAAYRGGRGELPTVLEAQRAVTETEITAIAIEAERARAWVNLRYLYPHEEAQ